MARPRLTLYRDAALADGSGPSLQKGVSVLVAQVTTDAVGNSGLLGMSLRDDHTAVVHYTSAAERQEEIL